MRLRSLLIGIPIGLFMWALIVATIILIVRGA